MALRYELDSLDGLDESLAGHYTQRDDGKFALSFEGVDPVAGAVNAKNHEKQARQQAEQKLTDLSTQITTLTNDLSNAKFELEKAGGATSKTEAYERKISELNDKLAAKGVELDEVKALGEKAMSDYIGDQYLDKIASDIGVTATAAAALKQLCKGSIIAEKGDDGYKQAYMIDGKPAVMTEQEFRAQIEAKYPDLVKGSQASGAGGDNNSKPSGGAGGSNGSGSMVDRARNILKNHK